MKKRIAFTLLSLLIVIFTACDSGSSTRVTIRTGLGSDSRAIAPPVAIESLTIEISGPNDYSFLNTYTGTADDITLELPEPGDYSFSLTAHVDSNAISPMKIFVGNANATMESGSNEVVVTMGLAETKILIPDLQNQRLVQIDSFGDAASWKSLYVDKLKEIDPGIVIEPPAPTRVYNPDADIYIIDTFSPTDATIDRAGNIYITNGGYDENGAIFKIDSIDPTKMIRFSDNPDGYYTALAIDDANNYLYYAANDSLYRKSLAEGSQEELIDTKSFQMGTITGIAIDSDGYIYVAVGGVISAAYKISIGTNMVATSILDTSNSVIQNPFDVMIKDNTLYVTDNNPSTPAIHQVNKETMTVAATFTDSKETSLYGPGRFVGISNNEIIFTDEDLYGSFDQLVKISDITGTGYDSFVQQDVEIGEFQFYYVPEEPVE